MERMAWTDERVDDFVGEMREFRRETREEFRALRAEMREGFAAQRAEFAASQRQMVQISFGLASLLLAQLIALIVAIALNA